MLRDDTPTAIDVSGCPRDTFPRRSDFAFEHCRRDSRHHRRALNGIDRHSPVAQILVAAMAAGCFSEPVPPRSPGQVSLISSFMPHANSQSRRHGTEGVAPLLLRRTSTPSQKATLPVTMNDPPDTTAIFDLRFHPHYASGLCVISSFSPHSMPEVACHNAETTASPIPRLLGDAGVPAPGDLRRRTASIG